jgi:RHS repeat-associated protein
MLRRWNNHGSVDRLRGLAKAATVLAVAYVVLLFIPLSAVASSKVITENMAGIVEWVYRNGAVADPLPCESACKSLWTAEHEPESASSQGMWDELGELETTDTNLWGSMSELRSELREVSLGPVPLKVGLELGYGGPDPKWMEIIGPTEPTVPAPACKGEHEWGTIFQSAGQEIGSTFEEKDYSPGNEWYLTVCGVNEIVASLAFAENPSEPGERCGAGGWSVPGWQVAVWEWNRCGEGTFEGKEVWSPMEAEAFYQKFHFSRPEDWTHQEIPSGEYVHNNEWLKASDPGIPAVEAATKSALETGPSTERWIEWQLEGKHGPNPLSTTLEEEYGSNNEAEPNKQKCLSGYPVNCATGNQTETHTDLSVGGRGPGLRLTRTYNSQLAAHESSPGPFGYGWTGPYSARLEVNEEPQEATVYQSNGSTARFLHSGGKWVPALPLIQATLAKEGSNYVYTLPNQTILHFNSSGQLTSETDRNGNSITMSYNAKNQLESVTDDSGRKLTFAYDGEGFVESAKDPMGHTVKYAYGSGNLVSVTEPGETKATWKFKYDSSHEITEETDGLGNTIKSEYDGSHRVVSQTDALSRKRSWKYTSTEAGTETTITEPNGSTTVEAFNVAGEPTSITRASGTPIAQTTKNEYDDSYNLVATTDPDGHTVRYAYDPEGNRTAETDALGNVTEWTYDSTHDVISVTTPNGETTTIKRNSYGNAETIERPAPEGKTQTTKYAYAAHGEVESMTDPVGHVWKYEYDTNGDRTAEIDPEGNKRTWEYNEDSQDVATVSPRGNLSGAEPAAFTTTIERDQQGRPASVTKSPREPSYNSAFGSSGSGNGQFQFPTLGALTSADDLWVADSSLDRLQKFNEKGEYQSQFGSEGTGDGQFKFPFGVAISKTTGNIYVSDRENYRIQEFSSTGTFIRAFGYGVSDGAEKYEICTSGCRAGIMGSNVGEFWEPDGITIDSSGNLWIVDEVNDRLEEISENGEYLNEYGGKGTGDGQLSEPVAITYDDGHLYVTEAGDNRVQEFSTEGTYISKFGSEGASDGQFEIPYAIATGPSTHELYVTDRDNNRVEIFTASGKFLSSFGSKGKGSHQMESPTGIVATASETLYISDHNNERIDNWTGLTARITKYLYDADGNLESMTDPNGGTTKYSYDADNELTRAEEPNGTATETEYDAAGQTVQQIDGNKHTTKYVRNALEEVTEVIDPLSRKTTKKYDAAGNLTSVTDAAERTTTYKYDPANQLTEITYSDGKTHTVKYEYDRDGNRTDMTDGTGTTTYAYDQLDRLTEAENGHKEVVKYEYNLDNQPTKITYPNGKSVTRSYDKDGRLEKTTDWLEHTTKFTYDPDSDLTATVYPTSTGEEDTYAYNLSGQTSEIKMTRDTETLASLTYARDSDDQVDNTVSKGLLGSEFTEASYDANNRLTKTGTTAYEYDAANNPTKIGPNTYKYDSADELEDGSGATYTYNEAGERTKTTPETGPATTYSYDQAGNLTAVERPKEGAISEIKDTYGYNGEGLRTSQTVSGTTSYIAWDMTDDIPLILSDGTNSYIYGPDNLPIEQIDNAEKAQYLHHDQAGSTQFISSETGTTEAAYSYTPYGAIEEHTGTAATPFDYDGQYTNSDTGLIYLRARIYDPTTAQFLSVDPLTHLTRAPYTYAQDNPVNRADLTGLCTGFGPEPSGCNGSSSELGPHVFCEPTKHEAEQLEKELEENYDNEVEESNSKLAGQEAWGNGGEPYGGEPKDAPPEEDAE